MFGHDKIENMIKNQSKYTQHSLDELRKENRIRIEQIMKLDKRVNELEFIIKELRQ